MLKHIAVLSLFCCYFAGAGAQEAVAMRHYVFERFGKGSVLQKNGSSHEAMLNYNVLSREIVFASSPGQCMALAFPEKVDTVFILGRKFIPVDNEFYELLTATKYPLLLYACTVKEPGASGGVWYDFCHKRVYSRKIADTKCRCLQSCFARWL